MPVEIAHEDDRDKDQARPGGLAQQPAKQGCQQDQYDQVTQKIERVIDWGVSQAERRIQPAGRVERPQIGRQLHAAKHLRTQGHRRQRQVKAEEGNQDRACFFGQAAYRFLVDAGLEEQITRDYGQDRHAGAKYRKLEKGFGQVKPAIANGRHGHIRWRMQHNDTKNHDNSQKRDTVTGCMAKGHRAPFGYVLGGSSKGSSQRVHTTW
jgi:hypothetical protein